jgi:hypothetical protein
MFFVAGCGGGNSVSINPTYEFTSTPSMQYIDNKLNITGTFELNETNTNLQNVEFSNLSFSDTNNCEIQYNITPLGENLYSYEINYTSCSDVSGLVLNGTETASYVDTDIKSISDTFTLNIGESLNTYVTEFENNLTNELNSTVSKIILNPSELKVVSGLTQQIKILTVDSNNKPVSTTLSINLPIDSNNKLYGTFDKYTVTTDDKGEAVITYTAPDSLIGLESEYDVKIQSMDNPNIQTYLKLDIQNEASDNSSTVNTYVLSVIKPDKFTVSTNGNIVVNIVENGNENVYIDNDNVLDVNISSTNNLVFFDPDLTKTTYEYNASSSKTIEVYTSKYSGLDVLKISALVQDGDKKVVITQEVPITVESGPISSISISYVSSSYDADLGLYTDIYSVHAVDKYSNPAKPGSQIVVGAIVSNKENGSYGKISYDGTETLFNDETGKTFDNVEAQDSLAILSSDSRTDGSYLGGWIINSISADKKTLDLVGDYNGSAVDLLKYVIGNEKRADECTGGVAVADFDHEDKTYQIGDDGTTLLKLRYDRYLIGKTITIYANSYQDKRVGIAMKRILYGNGVNADTKTCDATEATSNVTCDLKITLSLPDGNGFTMQNTRIGGFDIECQNGGYKINSETLTTDCNGMVEISITVDAGASCSVTWDKSIVYEY